MEDRGTIKTAATPAKDGAPEMPLVAASLLVLGFLRALLNAGVQEGSLVLS